MKFILYKNIVRKFSKLLLDLVNNSIRNVMDSGISKQVRLKGLYKVI